MRSPRTMAEPGRSGQSLGARDKLNFLLTLVPWLMDHERVTVAAAAEHFGVDERAVRDAVELIAVSGVPGDTASYQHGDLFDIAWDAFEERGEIVLTNLVAIDDAPRFSSREAAALIAGLQYLAALPENADSAAIASLAAKLSRGVTGTPAPLGVAGTREVDRVVALARTAMRRGVQLELDYRNARGEGERRRVDPLSIDSVDADWYLRGWCHLRAAVRTFRIDRMSDVVVTDEPISFRPGEVTLPERLFQGTPEDLEVILEVPEDALPLIADYLTPGVPRSTEDGRVRTAVRVSHLPVLARLVAGMPGVARVLGPEEARRAVADWARRGRERYPD